MPSERTSPPRAGAPDEHVARVPCDAPDQALAFLVDRLGFTPELLLPADDPVLAVVRGHGLRLELLRCEAPTAAPDPGRLAPAAALHRSAEEAGVGRAGMRYRDLLPGRLGGHVIASHIAIDAAGPVPDRVHHHEVRFQLIHCLRGRVRVVYEGQGEPFELAAGDGVLQPPGIRHRVLESAGGLEVLEVAGPAAHATRFDPARELPDEPRGPDARWGGQAFLRYRATDERREPWAPGLVARPSGMGEASGGRVDLRVVRPGAADATRAAPRPRLWYLARGEAELGLGDEVARFRAGDLAVVPAGNGRLAAPSPDLELVEVELGP